MPELPEVETTRRGIVDYIKGASIKNVVIRNHSLRWPVDKKLPQTLKHLTIRDVQRRAKYILILFDSGTLMIHLGMSGSLRITNNTTPVEKHDHIDIRFNNKHILRYRDPRRFGSVIWCSEDINSHPLLESLGPEPLQKNFSDAYFKKSCFQRKRSIKQHIMDSHIVVGVGNIYACEALFMSKISPTSQTGKLSEKRLERLKESIVEVLSSAIEQGGTTLKDFAQANGEPGYFQQKLFVYGREDKPCFHCQKPIKKIVQGQRSTFYCPGCQKN